MDGKYLTRFFQWVRNPKWLAFALVFLMLSCAKFTDEKDKNLIPEDDIVEDFDAALKELVDEMKRAIDVDIEEEHFDYDKAQVNLSVSSTNSTFEKFQIDIRYLQLIDIEGYSFTLFDHIKAGKPMSVDFAQLNHISRLLIAQPHVPVNAYKFLVIEFGFKDADISTGGTKVHLITDDGLVFGKEQINYRISVDLGIEPEMIVKNGVYSLDMALHIDDSTLSVPFLDNALPDGEKAMIFHPSLWMGSIKNSVMVEGDWDTIEDVSIKLKPMNIKTSKKYRDYFESIDLQINDATSFSVNGKAEDYDEATASLVTKSSGFVALKGMLDSNDKNKIRLESLVYHDKKPDNWSGMPSGLASQPEGIHSFMIWVDELPPNYSLNKLLGSGLTLAQVPINDDIEEKSHRIHRVEGKIQTDDDDYPSTLAFDADANFSLEGYSLLNPHISRYGSYDGVGSTLKELIENGAFAYSVLVQGEPSSGKITAKNNATHYAKFRYRGRTIDGALARTVFDEDIHGEKKWLGLTLAQIGAIFGSVMGLLLLEVILERNKIGPSSQARAPDFCKPNKKGDKGAKAPADGGKVKGALKSAGGAIGSIGGVASCLKKLSTFSASEPELSRFSRQINTDALYLDGEDGSKHSALAMLRNKKLSKKGLEFYQAPENKEKLNRVLEASKKLKQVSNKKFGSLRELNSSVFLDAADRLKMNLTKNMRTDVDVYTKMTEIDAEISDKVLKKSADLDFKDPAVKKAFYEGLKAASNAQNDGKTVGEVADAFNEKMVNDADKIVVDETKKSTTATSPTKILDQQIQSIDETEDAVLKYQVDPSEKHKMALNSALGKDLDADIDPKSLGNIQDQMKSQRETVSEGLLKVNSDSANILKTLNERGAFSSSRFFEFQAERVIREKLIDDTKKAVISEASSGEKISISKVSKAYIEARNEVFKAANKDAESRKQKLNTSLDSVIDSKKSFIDPTKIIKKRK